MAALVTPMLKRTSNIGISADCWQFVWSTNLNLSSTVVSGWESHIGTSAQWMVLTMDTVRFADDHPKRAGEAYRFDFWAIVMFKTPKYKYEVQRYFSGYPQCFPQWNIPRGSVAVVAAGKVPQDFWFKGCVLISEPGHNALIIEPLADLVPESGATGAIGVPEAVPGAPRKRYLGPQHRISEDVRRVRFDHP